MEPLEKASLLANLFARDIVLFVLEDGGIRIINSASRTWFASQARVYYFDMYIIRIYCKFCSFPCFSKVHLKTNCGLSR